MTTAAPTPDLESGTVGLDAALERIAAGAAGRDAAPAGAAEFPHSAFALLREAGALSWNAQGGPVRPPAALELALVRRVAGADGSVGRIFDGHLNAVERIAVQAPEWVRGGELRAVLAGELLAGVWGGDPVPGEGPPAAVVSAGGGEVLRGVKTFCSGTWRSTLGGTAPAAWWRRSRTGWCSTMRP
jgi:alkylation response protein AidB-like acyl-CoA dehydrogenase